MAHRNAPLTPTGRLRLARCVIEHGWTLRQAAYPDFLDWCNYHHPHTGIGGQVPAARVTNLTQQHS